MAILKDNIYATVRAFDEATPDSIRFSSTNDVIDVSVNIGVHDKRSRATAFVKIDAFVMETHTMTYKKGICRRLLMGLAADKNCHSVTRDEIFNLFIKRNVDNKYYFSTGKMYGPFDDQEHAKASFIMLVNSLETI